eukprot:7611865-Pyramimonas_sp.AAC.1
MRGVRFERREDVLTGTRCERRGVLCAADCQVVGTGVRPRTCDQTRGGLHVPGGFAPGERPPKRSRIPSWQSKNLCEIRRRSGCAY